MKYNTERRTQKADSIHKKFTESLRRCMALLCAVAILFTSGITVEAKDASTAIRIGIDVSR